MRGFQLAVIALAAVIAVAAGNKTALEPKPLTVVRQCPAIHDDDELIYMEHESFCFMYYVCRFGTAYPMYCPIMNQITGDRLYFNPAKEECDWPSEVACGGSPTPPIGKECSGSFRMSHETNCGYYYECVNGKKQLRACGNGLHFNPFAQECQIPSEAGCGGAVPTPKPTPPVGHECVGDFKSKHDTNCGYYYECVNGKKQLKACGGGLHFNPFAQECQSPSEAGCDAVVPTPRPTPRPTPPPVAKECEGSFKLAHESICGYYYECVNGKKTLRACGGGLHFNPFAQECQIPSEAGCDSAPKPVPTPRPTPPPSGHECVGSFKSKHETNCGYFYECVNGKKQLKACGSGLHFNPFAQECQIPSEAGCDSAPKPVPTPRPTPPPVAKECEGTHKLQHDTNCAYYYECVNGKKQLRACGTGLHFNPFAQQCQIPSEAGCDKAPKPVPTPRPTPPPAGHECVGNFKSKHETNCGYYYECVNGKKQLKACGGGLHFNPFAQQCQTPSEAGCNNAPKPVPTPRPTPPPAGHECVGNFKSKHETNCGYYYECVNGKKQLRTCGGGLHFNPFAQQCQTPSEAGCNGGVAPTPRPTPKPKPPPSGNQCVGDFKSPHDTNCGYYYDCVNGKKQLRACGGGLHFNPFAQECQDPSLAGCNKFFEMLLNAIKPAHTSEKVSETSIAFVAKTS